jgi:predicted AAA+ superfamily ATPase
MTLRKDGYLPRIIDDKIRSYLEIFGAISIEGPKWCGKTWTALNHANTARYLMDPSSGVNYRETAMTEPALILEGEEPVLIDEWQEVPRIWDAVRFAVDQKREKGRFLLTGSTKPPLEKVKHSGAGRIARIMMRPMTLFESGDSTGRVSFEKMMSGHGIEPSLAEIGLRDLIAVTARGGWPANLEVAPMNLQEIPLQYVETLAVSDISSGDRRRDPVRVRTLLRSLARNNATIVSNATIRKDIIGAHEDLSPNTITEYISALLRLNVIEEIPGWNPGIRSKTRIRMSPKKVFVDPSLAIAALAVSIDDLVFDLNTFGFMFENLCLRDLSCYAEALGGRVYHYRDSNGLEADAIVELRGGAWGAFEIKLGEHRIEEGVGSLIALKEKMEKEGARPPSCLCVLTGGGLAHKRDDGIYIVPLNALKG